MKAQKKHCLSSLVKKYLMALTGLVMAGFVFIHMIGNLQMFQSPAAINHYAHLLQTLPKGVLWGFRATLFLSVVVHVWMAILLVRENRRARPEDYYAKDSVQATRASRTMGLSGSFLLFFIVFHVFHFTVRSIFPEFQSGSFYTMLDGERIYDVYKMVVVGFSTVWVSVLYIICMIFLCLHLTHAISSMFQSLGFRNRKWKTCLDRFALVYGWVIFLGFVAIPIGVLTHCIPAETDVDQQQAVVQFETLNTKDV